RSPHGLAAQAARDADATSRARGLRDDPVALWWHLAERMPPKSPDPGESQAGLILLAALAAQSAEDPDVTAARLLSAIGWLPGDGTEFTELTAGHASWDTMISAWGGHRLTHPAA